MDIKIKIGVSSCLLGEKGTLEWGTTNRIILFPEILANYFEYISICPEMEVGMGVPRGKKLLFTVTLKNHG
ncbi:MAG: hypothetical protein CM1200mP16_06150 [Nitrospina sp.]|nr:MAG: hypothetical protein CM1200mP16_06150 [Nitrospina sp.]